jgi:Flp pilus assembly protein CpaB
VEAEEKMNRGIQILIGILCVLFAGAAGIYGRNTYLKEVSTYPIPVPIHAIPPYTLLSADQFQMREMPRTLESLPYFQTISEITGLISTGFIPAGLPIAKTSAVTPSLFRLADTGLEVLSIPVAPVSAVGGQVQIGQRVNLYHMIEKQSEENGGSSRRYFVVEAIASSVLVVDVRNSQGAQAGPVNRQQESGPLGTGEQIEQVQILTLALEPGRVQPVLEAVATAEKQGGLLWTTLALP